MIPSLSALFRHLVKPNITRLDFSGLLNIGTVSSGVFDAFNKTLTEVLSNVPNLSELILSSKNCRTSLPQCKNEHLEVLGSKCPELTFLDISYIRTLTSDGLRHLIPDSDPATYRPGCIHLKKLFIFECPFHHVEIAKLVVHLPELTDLGCNETGKVIKHIFKKNQVNKQTNKQTNKQKKKANKQQNFYFDLFYFVSYSLLITFQKVSFIIMR